MTPEDREGLARQLMDNPLLQTLLGDMERRAIEQMIAASDDEGRLVAQLRVQAVREFRASCEAEFVGARGWDAPV